MFWKEDGTIGVGYWKVTQIRWNCGRNAGNSHTTMSETPVKRRKQAAAEGLWISQASFLSKGTLWKMSCYFVTLVSFSHVKVRNIRTLQGTEDFRVLFQKYQKAEEKYDVSEIKLSCSWVRRAGNESIFVNNWFVVLTWRVTRFKAGHVLDSKWAAR